MSLVLCLSHKCEPGFKLRQDIICTIRDFSTFFGKKGFKMAFSTSPLTKVHMSNTARNVKETAKFYFLPVALRLERVFRCYIACETMEDYKEGCLMVWANYMSPCNSIIGLYFKGTCDVISVTMAMHEVHKSVL